MKNRKTIYLLLFAVLMVWGVVIHRIVNIAADENPVSSGSMAIPKTESRCSDTLLLNYRDPFLEQENPVPPKKEQRPAKIPPILPPEIQERPLFTYKGLIHKKKSSYAVISRDAVTESFASGETIDGFRLETISSDSITLRKGKNRYTLKLE